MTVSILVHAPRQGLQQMRFYVSKFEYVAMKKKYIDVKIRCFNNCVT